MGTSSYLVEQFNWLTRWHQINTYNVCEGLPTNQFHDIRNSQILRFFTTWVKIYIFNRFIYVLETNMIITRLKILELLVNIHTLIGVANLWKCICTVLNILKNWLYIIWYKNLELMLSKLIMIRVDNFAVNFEE